MGSPASSFSAWAKKVFDATAAASDTGYNTIGWEFAGEGEEGTAQTTFEDAVGSGFMKGWGFVKDGRNMVVYLDEPYDTDKDSAIGRELYYYGVEVDIAYGMEKSLDETWQDMEDALDEYGDEIQDALDDYTN